MKGVGWIVILLSLLGVTYLVTRDIDSLRGHRGEQAVVEPLQRAAEAASVVTRTEKQLDEGLKKIDE